MEGLLNGILMSLVFFLFLVRLRKQYSISFKMMAMLHILFTATGAFGASLGAVLSGMTWAGKRLHMLMVVDSITLSLLCKLLKKDEVHLGDYLAIPVVTVCAAAKVGCVIFRCCYGIVLYTNSKGIAVRFPSQEVELFVWIMLTVWLFYIEKKGTVTGFLWPIALIWFGILRFSVDFMRGSLVERTLNIVGIPIGAFWSAVVLLMGIAYLFNSCCKQWRRKASAKEMLRIALGLSPVETR